jgi:hypothetical protein
MMRECMCRFTSFLPRHWLGVVSFTPRTLYPLDRRLGGKPKPIRKTWRRENCCPCLYLNIDKGHEAKLTKTKLRGLSPRANYTVRATAARRQSDCQLLRIEGGQRDGSLRPYSRFSRQEQLLFYQAAPQLYSRGWVDPGPDPLLFFLVVPRIEPGTPDL